MSSPELHQLGQVRSGPPPAVCRAQHNAGDVVGPNPRVLLVPFQYRTLLSPTHACCFFPCARWLSPINLQSGEVADSRIGRPENPIVVILPIIDLP